jgi:predicted DNA-binding transcriptional regulator AlpA
MTRRDPIYPSKLAANYCGYSERQFIRYRNQGKGPAYIKTAGKVLYRQSDLDAWLDSKRVKPVREGVA